MQQQLAAAQDASDEHLERASTASAQSRAAAARVRPLHARMLRHACSGWLNLGPAVAGQRIAASGSLRGGLGISVVGWALHAPGASTEYSLAGQLSRPSARFTAARHGAARIERCVPVKVAELQATVDEVTGQLHGLQAAQAQDAAAREQRLRQAEAHSAPAGAAQVSNCLRPLSIVLLIVRGSAHGVVLSCRPPHPGHGRMQSQRRKVPAGQSDAWVPAQDALQGGQAAQAGDEAQLAELTDRVDALQRCGLFCTASSHGGRAQTRLSWCLHACLDLAVPPCTTPVSSRQAPREGRNRQLAGSMSGYLPLRGCAWPVLPRPAPRVRGGSVQGEDAAGGRAAGGLAAAGGAAQGGRGWLGC